MLAQVLPQVTSPAGQLQTPAVQVAPRGQKKPHAPQFCSLVAVSTQPMVGPQLTAPAPQTHWPDTHMPSGPHLLPHTPQLLTSAARSAQVFCWLHATWPTGQAVHMPDTHI